MSESNGKQPVLNRILLEAWTALTAPDVGGNERLPVIAIGSRLALNRNHLRPVIQALEEAQNALATQCKVRAEDLKEVKPREQAERMEVYQQRFKELAEQTTEWAPVARIELRKFTEEAGVKPNSLAALLEAGIVTNDPPEEKK